MMRHVPNDKYTVAWFKLAECVAKGEKEKAFGVCKLLQYSFDDAAYALQLEADLLYAFQDVQALDKYEQAAQIYFTQQRYKEAAALYEDLALIQPEQTRYLTRLIEIYRKHKNQEIIELHAEKFCYSLIDLKNFQAALVLCQEFLYGYAKLRILLLKLTSCILSHESKINNALMDEVIDFACKALREDQKSLELNAYLAELKELSSEWHAKALLLLR